MASIDTLGNHRPGMVKKAVKATCVIGLLVLVAGFTYFVIGPVMRVDWAYGRSEEYRIREITASASSYVAVEIASARGCVLLTRPGDDEDIAELLSALASVRFTHIPAPTSRLQGMTILWFEGKPGVADQRIELAIDPQNGNCISRYLRSEEVPKVVTDIIRRHPKMAIRSTPD